MIAMPLVRSSVFSRLVASHPSTRGIIRSMRTTRGRTRTATSIASPPSCARWTTKPQNARYSDSISRASRSSSTTRTDADRTAEFEYVIENTSAEQLWSQSAEADLTRARDAPLRHPSRAERLSHRRDGCAVITSMRGHSPPRGAQLSNKALPHTGGMNVSTLETIKQRQRDWASRAGRSVIEHGYCDCADANVLGT